MKKNSLLLLMLALLNLSCSRFFHISKEDLKEYEKDVEIKLVLKDGKELLGNKFSFDVNNSDTSLVLITEFDTQSIPISEIEKFYINKTDYPMTIFMSFWIFVAVLFITLGIEFSGFSIGG